MSGKKWALILVGGGAVALVAMCTVLVVAVSVVGDELSEELGEMNTTQGIEKMLQTDAGREYMLRQPCEDVMIEYDSMLIAGDTVAKTHVANVYNLKADLSVFIATSDAAAAVERCK